MAGADPVFTTLFLGRARNGHLTKVGVGIGVTVWVTVGIRSERSMAIPMATPSDPEVWDHSLYSRDGACRSWVAGPRCDYSLVSERFFGRLSRRRGTEEVVTGPTRNRITVQKTVRGFESHPLRQPTFRK